MTSPPQQFTNLDVLNKFGKALDLEKPKILIVGLCGGQGAGKTKLSTILSKNIKNSTIIEERSYYKKPNKRKLSYEVQPLFEEYGGYSKERKLLLVDLSNPASYNYEKLYQDLLALKEGNPITIKKFNEETESYAENEIIIDPKIIPLVLLEGYFIFKDKKVRDLIDLKIFVEIDDDIRLSRLLLNENKFLNNDSLAIKNFFMIYKNYIKTSYEQYIEPTKHEARIILPNYTVRDDEVIDGDETFESLVLMLKSIVKSRNSDYKDKAHPSNK
jgi:uridine kinase